VLSLKNEKLNQFKDYQRASKIKQVALTAISVQASPDDIKDLKELFKSLDTNGDGSISLKELHRGLAKKENGETILELMKSIDTDGSGEINYTEFLAATLDASVFMREDYLKTAFKMFDTNGNGKIDHHELR